MPPRQARPQEKNRPRRPRRAAQHSSETHNNAENETTGIHSEGDFGSEIPDPMDPPAKAAGTQPQESYPVTPLKYKDKKPNNVSIKNDPNLENNRRRQPQTSKSQSKPTTTPKHQTPRPNENLTPKPPPSTQRIVSETTPKLYAGPGFHASPAASSLPMPKFMSKSVPDVNKTTSLAKMLEQTQEVSSNEDESPTKAAVNRQQPRQAREESPLDIFFRSDREAKARQSSLTSKNLSAVSGNLLPANLGTPDATPYDGSSPRHHMRHHTDSSANGMFPFEMENNARESSDTPLPANNSLPPHATDPSSGDTQDYLHHKSLALKKLLNFSDPNIAGPRGPSPMTADPSTPPPRPKTQTRSSARLSGTPPMFPKGLEGASAEERQAALLALAEKQISMPTQSQTQRPPSSSLWKELKMPSSPQALQNQQPPSTPTPPNRKDQHGSKPAKLRAPATTGHISTIPTVHSGNARPTLTSPTRDPGMKSMEDDLRRILKLDIRSDGVNAVKS